MATSKAITGMQQLQMIQQLQTLPEKRSGIGAVWSNSTASIASAFKVAERLAYSAESLAESAEMNAELSLTESAEEFCNSMGLVDDEGKPYRGFMALAIARQLRGR